MLAVSIGGETLPESTENMTMLKVASAPLTKPYLCLLSWRVVPDQAKTPSPALLQERAEMRELE